MAQTAPERLYGRRGERPDLVVRAGAAVGGTSAHGVERDELADERVGGGRREP